MQISRMSAYGPKQTSGISRADVRFGSMNGLMRRNKNVGTAPFRLLAKLL